ncbi:unnamed protein product [Fraxinus pennsylvanica]|uniref:Uncharacterized protein n=1 Tax=Fraxinus pennsylvanica TaxID=56036 RepID=A0AAD2A6Z9_9LAMI|nr:unnamed protein product [Fraxinus pennsylvanica]
MSSRNHSRKPHGEEEGCPRTLKMTTGESGARKVITARICAELELELELARNDSISGIGVTLGLCVPNSAPSKKGHDVTIDEKLIARHLAAMDRILRSVPSPGVGN